MWGLGSGGSRGPRRALSTEQIVDAAVTVAEQGGLVAVSMARVAQELGFTTMSLYRYVDSKDTLIELMQDRVIGLPPELPADANWRTALEIWARAEYRTIQRHPFWLDIPISGPPRGPNNMAWLETGLAALDDSPFPPQMKLLLLLNLSLFVISQARFARDATDSDDFAPVLRRVLDPAQFPALSAVLAEGSLDDDNPPGGTESGWAEGLFEFGLGRLLDGYAALSNTP
ncbi:TetR/AcrR family transcriptional regulator [Nocardia stercoris]|uniref:TetR/AcrR family transcriptional regulator n=1 Tax=Nocardia stercoris TaxID=2483361 RepID=A0A3M2LCZ9_9NOCA|nr:TetR/AcrR family transcriptional regulator [Nocardia stercoris]